MFHELLADVRGEASGERALDMVRALTRHHRVQASPGLDAASGWLAGQLEAAGLAVDVERVPADGRTRRLGDSGVTRCPSKICRISSSECPAD